MELTVENIGKMSPDELMATYEVQMVSLEAHCETIERLLMLQDQVITNGPSRISMEALVAIDSDALDPNYPASLFTSVPSDLNQDIALESFGNSLANALSKQMSTIALLFPILIALVLGLIKLLSGKFSTLTKLEEYSESEADEIVEKYKDAVSGSPDNIVDQEKFSEDALKRNQEFINTLESNLVAKFNTALDGLILERQPAYTMSTAMDTCKVHVELMTNISNNFRSILEQVDDLFEEVSQPGPRVSSNKVTSLIQGMKNTFQEEDRYLLSYSRYYLFEQIQKLGGYVAINRTTSVEYVERVKPIRDIGPNYKDTFWSNHITVKGNRASPYREALPFYDTPEGHSPAAKWSLEHANKVELGKYEKDYKELKSKEKKFSRVAEKCEDDVMDLRKRYLAGGGESIANTKRDGNDGRHWHMKVWPADGSISNRDRYNVDQILPAMLHIHNIGMPYATQLKIVGNSLKDVFKVVDRIILMKTETTVLIDAYKMSTPEVSS